jgi:hypothetical protein
VDLSDDLPPPRRPLFFPVVIATIFLTIIGMSAGLVLSARHRNAPPPVSSGQNDGYVPPTSAPASATASPTPTRRVPSKPAPSVTPDDGAGTFCRPETQKVALEKYGVTSRLRVVLFIRTKSSAIWICRADDEQMYYHANTSADGTWVEGTTALFLPDVIRGEDDYHTTAPDGTTFSVNKLRLLIRHKDGQEENQPAVKP